MKMYKIIGAMYEKVMTYFRHLKKEQEEKIIYSQKNYFSDLIDYQKNNNYTNLENIIKNNKNNNSVYNKKRIFNQHKNKNQN